MKISLSVKDRIIILTEVLPPFGSKKWMSNNISIRNKIKLTIEEEGCVLLKPSANKVLSEVVYLDKSLANSSKDFDFSEEEILYLKELIGIIDERGGFTENNLTTLCLLEDYANNL